VHLKLKVAEMLQNYFFF